MLIRLNESQIGICITIVLLALSVPGLQTTTTHTRILNLSPLFFILCYSWYARIFMHSKKLSYGGGGSISTRCVRITHGIDFPSHIYVRIIYAHTSGRITNWHFYYHCVTCFKCTCLSFFLNTYPWSYTLSLYECQAPSTYIFHTQYRAESVY